MAKSWHVWVAPVFATLTAAATILAFVASAHGAPRFAALLIAGGVAYLLMVMADRRYGGLSIRSVIGVAAATAAAMVAFTPRTTGDLWMYAVYGRMAALHLNPWTHVPAVLGTDPMLALTGKRWIHMPSMYGPVMVWIERAASPFLGSSALATRWYYQGIALGALGLSVAVVWKHTRSASAVAYLALNPVVLVHLVNGARNDVLVGLAMVVAVVMVTDGHDALPAGIVGGAVLVKLTAGVGVLAIVWWLLAHRGIRAAVRAAVAAGAVVVVGTALAGVASLTVPLRRAGQLFSSGSAWTIIGHLHLHYPPTRVAVAIAATLTIVVLARHVNGSPALAVAAALGVWTIALPYVLPGYLGWTIATAALERRSRVATVLAVESIVFVSGYALVRAPWWPATLETPLRWVMPLASLAAVVAIVLDPTDRERRHDERDSAEPVPARSHDGAPIQADLRVLVVVPTYQEADNIEPLLRRLRAACPHADVLVVDDSSPDGTAARAEQLGSELGGIEVLRRSERGGLASAYADGFDIATAAGYDVAVEMDADRSHQPEQIVRLLHAVDVGADVAIGSRYVKGGSVVGWPVRRLLLSRAGGGYARAMLHLPVHDTTSGFRAYRTSVLRAIDRSTLRSRGYGFQVEMTYHAVHAGARVVEVPITFHERVAGRSKMSSTIVLEAFTMVNRLAMTRRRRPVAAPQHVDH
jgi:dolichol-phosphate mannosyltransferase